MMIIDGYSSLFTYIQIDAGTQNYFPYLDDFKFRNLEIGKKLDHFWSSGDEFNNFPNAPGSQHSTITRFSCTVYKHIGYTCNVMLVRLSAKLP